VKSVTEANLKNIK